MVSLEHLAADLHRAGYRSVDAAEADGKQFELNKREEVQVDALLLKLWLATDP